MKRFIPILLLTLGIIHFSSCEKDDICVEGDTPLLVIGFFDINDTLVSKNVPALRVRELTLDNVMTSFTDRSSLDSIGLPLRLTAVTTGFAFITNSADDDDGNETGNIDTLSFDYTVNEKFISRACGFVGNYNGLDTTRQVFSTDWIKRISIVETEVENANAIHVKIFH